MKKYAILSLMLAMPWAHAETDVMEKAYHNYDKERLCYVGMNETENGVQKYCMILRAKEIVPNEHVDDRIKTYYLAVGDNFENYHAAQGNIGLILVDNGEGQDHIIIDEQRYIDAGSSGYAPEDYRFHLIGFNSHGFVTETGYTGQGVSQGGIMIVGDYDGKVFDAYIPTFYDDSGHYADSDRENLMDVIEGSYEFVPNDEYQMYDIKITLNGSYIGQSFKEQEYIMTFDEKMLQYNIPADYPLKDVAGL